MAGAPRAFTRWEGRAEGSAPACERTGLSARAGTARALEDSDDDLVKVVQVRAAAAAAVASAAAAVDSVAMEEDVATEEDSAQEKCATGFRPRAPATDAECSETRLRVSKFRTAIMKVRDSRTWGEAAQKYFPTMEHLAKALLTAVDKSRSQVFFVFWSSAEDVKACKGSRGHYCEDFDKTKSLLRKLQAAPQVAFEAWDVSSLALLHSGWSIADIVEDARRRGRPVAERFDRHGGLERVLLIQQIWTANLEHAQVPAARRRKVAHPAPLEGARERTQLEGWRPTWNMMKGDRNGPFYCASFFHLAAIAAEGKEVPVNLDKDANASRLPGAKKEEKAVEEDAEEGGEEDEAAGEKRKRYGLGLVDDQSQEAVAKTRQIAAMVAAETGSKAVKEPPRSQQMTAINAEKLVTRFCEGRTQLFGTTKEVVAKVLVPLLVRGGYVRLEVHKRVEAEASVSPAEVPAGDTAAPVPAGDTAAPGLDIGWGFGLFNPATYPAKRVFVLPGETRKGYEPVQNRKETVYIDVDLEQLLLSWNDGSYRGPYSLYRNRVQSIMVTTSLNEDSPYCWFSAQATNSSAVYCMLLVLSAIVHSGGPAGTKGEFVRLTSHLIWEHWLEACARGGTVTYWTIMRVLEGASPADVMVLIKQMNDLGLKVERSGSFLALTDGTLTNERLNELQDLVDSNPGLVRGGVNQSNAGFASYYKLLRVQGGASPDKLQKLLEQIKSGLNLEFERDGDVIALTDGTLTNERLNELQDLVDSNPGLVCGGVNQSRAGTFARLAPSRPHSLPLSGRRARRAARAAGQRSAI